MGNGAGVGGSGESDKTYIRDTRRKHISVTYTFTTFSLARTTLWPTGRHTSSRLASLAKLGGEVGAEPLKQPPLARHLDERLDLPARAVGHAPPDALHLGARDADAAVLDEDVERAVEVALDALLLLEDQNNGRGRWGGWVGGWAVA